MERKAVTIIKIMVYCLSVYYLNALCHFWVMVSISWLGSFLLSLLFCWMVASRQSVRSVLLLAKQCSTLCTLLTLKQGTGTKDHNQLQGPAWLLAHIWGNKSVWITWKRYFSLLDLDSLWGRMGGFMCMFFVSVFLVQQRIMRKKKWFKWFHFKNASYLLCFFWLNVLWVL